MSGKYTCNTEIKLGSIITQDLGYSMCIPKFYRVKAHKGKKTLVLECLDRIDADTHGACGWQGRCIPGDFNGKLSEARISKSGYLSLNGHYASVWSGEPLTYDFMD